MLKKIKFNLESVRLLLKFKRGHKKQEEIAVNIIKQFQQSTK